MKVIWEAGDIRCGRVFGREGITERWMIGYICPESSVSRIVTVSLSDGLVSPQHFDRETLARTLTDGSYMPEEFLEPEMEEKS